jgi:hypothetical protein
MTAQVTRPMSPEAMPTLPEAAVCDLYLLQLERLSLLQPHAGGNAASFAESTPRDMWRRVAHRISELEALAAVLAIAHPEALPPTTTAVTVWSQLREAAADLANLLALYLARSAPRAS